MGSSQDIDTIRKISYSKRMATLDFKRSEISVSKFVQELRNVIEDHGLSDLLKLVREEALRVRMSLSNIHLLGLQFPASTNVWCYCICTISTNACEANCGNEILIKKLRSESRKELFQENGSTAPSIRWLTMWWWRLEKRRSEPQHFHNLDTWLYGLLKY